MFILVIDWIINASGWRPASSLWRGCQINLVINGLALLTVAVTGLVVGGISWSFIIQLLVVIQISDFVPCAWQGMKYLSSDKIMFTKLVGNLLLVLVGMVMDNTYAVMLQMTKLVQWSLQGGSWRLCCLALMLHCGLYVCVSLWITLEFWRFSGLCIIVALTMLGSFWSYMKK